MNCSPNIITANFSGGKTSATTAALWQWDYGQVLCITGIEDLPAAFEVHFSTNRTGGVSTVAVGADGQVTIPNVLLTIGKNLNAWIYLSDSEGEGETEYSILIPVKARPMPETYDAEATGVFDDVVRQVSEYAETAQTAADSAGASASAAAASASAAAISETAAAQSASAAADSAGRAETSKTLAGFAADHAAQSLRAAAEKADEAAASATSAEQSKTAAAQSASAANSHADRSMMWAGTAEEWAVGTRMGEPSEDYEYLNAKYFKDRAQAFAMNAESSATTASAKAAEAAQSATAAQSAAQTATTKAAEASASATAAEAAKTAAQTAQAAAEAAKDTAVESSTTANAKAAEAAQSASGAAQSKADAEAAAARAEQAAATLTVDTALSDTSTNPVQNKVITGELTDVKSAIDDMDLLSVDALKRHNGMISSSGTWTSISSSYTHVVIPINGGDEISLTVGNATGYFAILTDYTTPVAGAALPFTSDTNLNTRLTLTLTDLYKRFIVPSDAHYLCVVVKYGSVGDVTPSSIVINGIEYVGSARKTIHEAIADVNDTLDEANVIPLSAVKGYYGIAQNTGKWGLVNAQHYVTKLIRINPGDEYYIVANANGLRFGVLTKKDAIATYESVSYSAASGYTAYIDLQSNGTASGVFPDDAKYLFINTIYNDVDRTPTKLEINGIDYLKSIREVLPGIRNQASDCITIQDVINGTISDVAWETGTWNTVVGSACTKVASATRKRTEKILQFPYPIEVRTDGTFSTSYRLVDDNGLVTESNTNYKTDTIRIPANQRFAIVVCLTSDSTADMSTYTSDEIKAGVSIGYYDLNTVVYPGVKWCAMGDSITQGYVSYINDSDVATSKVDKEAAWVTKVARKNNWQVTNLGIGGSGYVDWVNNTETVEDGRPAWYVARNTDFTPYNLVTLAYGINDWKGNHPTGTLTDSITTPETTIAAMRATIEAIIASNPHCKIIVILPMNCAGYSFNYGDESTNWGLGYRFANSGTLEEFVNALISVCNYYGIQYIDMTHYSCINRKNILDCLTDGVHPNAETHEILARELCRKITFN